MLLILLSCRSGTDLDGDGWTAALGDCNDNDAAIHPNADEVCNGLDDDCDGTIDDEGDLTWYVDADGDGHPGTAVSACEQPEGASAEATDCDDLDAKVSPDTVEVCDDADNDCDGAVDESPVSAPTWWADADGDGYGDPDAAAQACELPSGHVDNADDCDDADAETNPDTEWFEDFDGDGFGAALWGAQCEQPAGAVADASDCDDEAVDVHPGAEEMCNDLDEDCDDVVDEGAEGGIWEPLEDIPVPICHAPGVRSESHVYLLGGATNGGGSSGHTKTTWVAEVLEGNELSEWEETTSMNAGITVNHGATYRDGFIYSFGGGWGSPFSTMAEVDSDGSILSWSGLSSPDANGENAGVAVIGDYLYVFGGRGAEMSYAELDGGIPLGWTNGTSLPEECSASQRNAVYEDRLYVIGGRSYDLDVLFVGEQQWDGDLAWTEVDLPFTPYQMDIVEGHIVLLFDGGEQEYTTIYAEINGTTLGDWKVADDLPITGGLHTGGDVLYYLGGSSGGYNGTTGAWKLDICTD